MISSLEVGRAFVGLVSTIQHLDNDNPMEQARHGQQEHGRPAHQSHGQLALQVYDRPALQGHNAQV